MQVLAEDRGKWWISRTNHCNESAHGFAVVPSFSPTLSWSVSFILPLFVSVSYSLSLCLCPLIWLSPALSLFLLSHLRWGRRNRFLHMNGLSRGLNKTTNINKSLLIEATGSRGSVYMGWAWMDVICGSNPVDSASSLLGNWGHCGVTCWTGHDSGNTAHVWKTWLTLSADTAHTSTPPTETLSAASSVCVCVCDWDK